MDEEYLTRKETANYLKIGLSSVDKIIKNRRFTGKIKIGRRVLIIKRELDKFIKEQQQQYNFFK